MHMKRSECGQSIALLGLMMLFGLLGFLGIAIDVGMLYQQRRSVQQAADAAALAAAAQAGAGTSTNTSATEAAQLNLSAITVSANTGTPSTAYTAYVNTTTAAASGSLSKVIVTVNEAVPTHFMSIFGFGTVNVTATAAATYGGSTSNACFTALSQTGVAVPNASGVETDGSTTMTWGTTVMSDIATEGDSQINAPNCGIQACGPALNYYASGSGKTAAALYAWGSGNITAKTNTAPSYGTDNSGSKITAAPTVHSCTGDPLASTMPSTPVDPGGTCLDASGQADAWMGTGSGGGQAKTISAGVYCNFNTSNVSTLTMNPGTYYIRNNFGTNSGTTITGNGVTIVLESGASASGSVTNAVGGSADGIENGTTISLTAPTSGTYSGILFWDLNSGDTVTWGGGSTSTYSGILYAPNSNLVLGNGSGTTAVSSNIVANTIMVVGGSTITDNYTPSGGSSGGSDSSVNLIQ